MAQFDFGGSCLDAAGGVAYPFALRGVASWQGEALRNFYADVARRTDALGIASYYAERTFAPVRILREDGDRLVTEVASGQIMHVERAGDTVTVRFADPG